MAPRWSLAPALIMWSEPALLDIVHKLLEVQQRGVASPHGNAQVNDDTKLHWIVHRELGYDWHDAETYYRTSIFAPDARHFQTKRRQLESSGGCKKFVQFLLGHTADMPGWRELEAEVFPHKIQIVVYGGIKPDKAMGRTC